MRLILDPVEDTYIAKKILRGIPHEPGYSEIYAWTNEVLSKYYKYEDLSDKKALCVTSSGDHTLHAILAGAKYVDSFDVNKLTNYYAKLKIAMIKTYDFKTFLQQFNNGVYLKNNIDLAELSLYISDEVKEFWKIILNDPYYVNDQLYKTDGYYTSIEENCDYLNEKNFNELKEKLKHAIINYHDLNIRHYREDNELSTYDAIFISNIAEYSGDSVLRCGNKLLNNNGVLYNHHSSTNPQKNTIQGLKYEDCIITIDNVENTDEKCGVCIYRKK